MKKVHGHVMHSCISVTQCQRWWKFGKDQIVGRSHLSLPPGTSHGMPSAPLTSHQSSSCALSLLASWTPSLQDENHLHAHGRQVQFAFLVSCVQTKQTKDLSLKPKAINLNQIQDMSMILITLILTPCPTLYLHPVLKMNDDLKPFVSDNNKKKIVFYNNIYILSYK